MHVKVNKTEENKEITYPIVMESLTSGTIVLFINERVGVVLIDGESKKEKSSVCSHSWSPATDQRFWKPFKGTITITQ